MERKSRLEAAETTSPDSPVQFIDVAEKAGLNIPNVWGGIDQKRVIIETKGSGIAFFDYDNDGWLDIYLTNGNRLDAHWSAGKATHHASFQEQSRRHIHRRDGEVRTWTIRMADRRVRRRLRQRWLGRPVLHFLGPQHSLP